MAHIDQNLPAVPATNAPTEPALAVGVIGTIGAAVLTLVVAFGLPLTEAQTLSILGLLAVIEPVILAVFVRGKVFAPATVNRMVAAAKRETL